MDRYLIVLNASKGRTRSAAHMHEWFKNYSREKTSAENKCQLVKTGQVVCSLVYPGCKIVPDKSPWITVTDTLSPDQEESKEDKVQRESENEFVNGGTESFASTDLAEQLHQLADTIPTAGCIVDVLWVLQDQTIITDVSENLELYGALKRLQDWLHAQLYINNVHGRFLNSTMKGWADVLHAVVVGNKTTSHRCPLWRGEITVTGSQGSNCVRLPGFWIYAEEDCVPGRIRMTDDHEHRMNLPACLTGHLEILAEVDRVHVPSFMVTHHKYKLCIPSCSSHLVKSRALLQQLRTDPELCFVARLRYSTHKQLGPLKDTSKWKSQLIESLTSISGNSKPEDAPLDGQFYHFLLTSGGATGRPTSDSCSAYLLHPPEKFNGAAGHHLALLHTTPGMMDIEEEVHMQLKTVLEELPQFTLPVLMEMENNIATLQTQVLQQWIDEKKVGEEPVLVSAGELSHLLRKVRQIYMDTVKNDLHLPATRLSNSSVMLSAPKPEISLDPNNLLERHVLLYREEQTRKQEQEQGVGSCVPRPPPEQAPMVDVEEFLKHFKNDGTPAVDNLMPLTTDTGRTESSKGSKLLRINSNEFKLADWPQCSNHHFHGIHYNRGTKSEHLESQCRRLQAQVMGMETSSTCTLQQRHSRATVAMLTAGIRVKAQTQGKNKVKGLTQEKDIDKSKIRPKIPGIGTRTRTSPRAIAPKSRQPQPKIPKERTMSEPDRMRSQRQKQPATSDPSKMSRSERHKRKLEEIVKDSLNANGVTSQSDIYPSCASRLFSLTKSYVKDLKTSRNLRTEMQRIAECHVKQVINFERQRVGYK